MKFKCLTNNPEAVAAIITEQLGHMKYEVDITYGMADDGSYQFELSEMVDVALFEDIFGFCYDLRWGQNPTKVNPHGAIWQFSFDPYGYDLFGDIEAMPNITEIAMDMTPDIIAGLGYIGQGRYDVYVQSNGTPVIKVCL